MKTIKKLYYSFVCYDPIVEVLEERYDDKHEEVEKRQHVASPIFANRKQKREFYFEFIHNKTSSDAK